MNGQKPRSEASAARSGMAEKLLALLAVVALSLSLAFGIAGHVTDSAWAAPSSSESAQVVDADAPDSDADDQSADEAAATADADDESEEIDDDETPMSSGLGGGEPVSGGGVGFGGIVVIGIAAVAAFYFVITRRLNSNISDMRRMMK